MIGSTSWQVNLQRLLSSNPTQVATGSSWPVSDRWFRLSTGRLAAVARRSLTDPELPVATGRYREAKFAIGQWCNQQSSTPLSCPKGLADMGRPVRRNRHPCRRLTACHARADLSSARSLHMGRHRQFDNDQAYEGQRFSMPGPLRPRRTHHDEGGEFKEQTASNPAGGAFGLL